MDAITCWAAIVADGKAIICVNDESDYRDRELAYKKMRWDKKLLGEVIIRSTEDDDAREKRIEELSNALRVFHNYFSTNDPVYTGSLYTDDVKQLDDALEIAKGVK